MIKSVPLAMLTIGMTLMTFSSPAFAQTIEANKKVKFDYTLKVGEEIVETSEGKQPIEYVHGSGAIIPGLESQLAGMKVGDTKSVTVKPEDAYGLPNPEAVKEFPKTSFPKEMVAQIGMVVELQGAEGQPPLPGVIQEVKDTTVLVNFNHPLAGKTLTFDVKIVSVE
jgi:FKBP-type peptidyl-prolyl cis-trans isomerase SlyD